MNELVLVFSRATWLYWSILVCGFAVDAYELRMGTESFGSANQNVGSRRKLYNVISDQSNCLRCQSLGKEVCWDVHPDGSGEWERSFCCGTLGEQQCRDHFYCSSQISSPLLKEMTCPIDPKRCPSNVEGTIDLSKVPYGKENEITKIATWSPGEIRSETLCKYRIKVPKSIDYNQKLHLQVKQQSLHSYLTIVQDTGKAFTDSNALMKELTEQTNKFGVLGLGRDASKDEDVWLLFEPERWKLAGIKVVAWMESLKPPPQPEEEKEEDKQSEDTETPEQEDKETEGQEEQGEDEEASGETGINEGETSGVEGETSGPEDSEDAEKVEEVEEAEQINPNQNQTQGNSSTTGQNATAAPANNTNTTDIDAMEVPDNGDIGQDHLQDLESFGEEDENSQQDEQTTDKDTEESTDATVEPSTTDSEDFQGLQEVQDTESNTNGSTPAATTGPTDSSNPDDIVENPDSQNEEGEKQEGNGEKEGADLEGGAEQTSTDDPASGNEESDSEGNGQLGDGQEDSTPSEPGGTATPNETQDDSSSSDPTDAGKESSTSDADETIDEEAQKDPEEGNLEQGLTTAEASDNSTKTDDESDNEVETEQGPGSETEPETEKDAAGSETDSNQETETEPTQDQEQEAGTEQPKDSENQQQQTSNQTQNTQIEESTAEEQNTETEQQSSEQEDEEQQGEQAEQDTEASEDEKQEEANDDDGDEEQETDEGQSGQNDEGNDDSQEQNDQQGTEDEKEEETADTNQTDTGPPEENNTEEGELDEANPSQSNSNDTDSNIVQEETVQSNDTSAEDLDQSEQIATADDQSTSQNQTNEETSESTTSATVGTDEQSNDSSESAQQETAQDEQQSTENEQGAEETSSDKNETAGQEASEQEATIEGEDTEASNSTEIEEVDPSPSIQVTPVSEKEQDTPIVEVHTSTQKAPQENSMEQFAQLGEFRVEKDQLIMYLALIVAGSSCLTLSIVMICRCCRKKAKGQRGAEKEEKSGDGDKEHQAGGLDASVIKLKQDQNGTSMIHLNNQDQDSTFCNDPIFRIGFHNSTEQRLIGLSRAGKAGKPEDIASSTETDPHCHFEFASSIKQRVQPSLYNPSNKLDQTSSIGENIHNTMSDDFVDQISDIRGKASQYQQRVLFQDCSIEAVKTARNQGEKVVVMNHEVEDSKLPYFKNLGSGRVPSKEEMRSSRLRSSRHHLKSSILSRNSLGRAAFAAPDYERGGGNRSIELVGRSHDFANSHGKQQTSMQLSHRQVRTSRNGLPVYHRPTQSLQRMIFINSPKRELPGGSRPKSNHSRNPPSQRTINHLVITKSPMRNSRNNSQFQSFSECVIGFGAGSQHQQVAPATTQTLHDLTVEPTKTLELDSTVIEQAMPLKNHESVIHRELEMEQPKLFSLKSPPILSDLDRQTSWAKQQDASNINMQNQVQVMAAGIGDDGEVIEKDKIEIQDLCDEKDDEAAAEYRDQQQQNEASCQSPQLTVDFQIRINTQTDKQSNKGDQDCSQSNLSVQRQRGPMDQRYEHVGGNYDGGPDPAYGDTTKIAGTAVSQHIQSQKYTKFEKSNVQFHSHIESHSNMDVLNQQLSQEALLAHEVLQKSDQQPKMKSIHRQASKESHRLRENAESGDAERAQHDLEGEQRIDSPTYRYINKNGQAVPDVIVEHEEALEESQRSNRLRRNLQIITKSLSNGGADGSDVEEQPLEQPYQQQNEQAVSNDEVQVLLSNHHSNDDIEEKQITIVNFLKQNRSSDANNFHRRGTIQKNQLGQDKILEETNSQEHGQEIAYNLNVGFLEDDNQVGKTVNDQFTSRNSSRSREGSHHPAVEQIDDSGNSHLPKIEKNTKRQQHDSNYPQIAMVENDSDGRASVNGIQVEVIDESRLKKNERISVKHDRDGSPAKNLIVIQDNQAEQDNKRIELELDKAELENKEHAPVIQSPSADVSPVEMAYTTFNNRPESQQQLGAQEQIVEEEARIKTTKDERPTPKTPQNLLLKNDLFQRRLEQHLFQNYGFDAGLGNSFNTSNLRGAPSFANSNSTSREGKTVDRLEQAKNQLPSLLGSAGAQGDMRSLQVSRTPVARMNRNSVFNFEVTRSQKYTKKSKPRQVDQSKAIAPEDVKSTQGDAKVILPPEQRLGRSRQQKSLFQSTPLSRILDDGNDANKQSRTARLGGQREEEPGGGNEK